MLENLFKLKEHKTNVKTEVVAGISTFMTMAYIIALNPNLLTGFGGEGADLWNAVFLATVLSAGVGTLLMAFLANKPFALAPGMGLNAYFATVVSGIAVAAGISYTEAFQGGLAIILFSGVLFTVLTVLRIREKIVAAIPQAVRHGIPAGIGLMIVDVGLTTNAGIYTADGSCYYILDFFTNGPSSMAALMGDSYNTMLLYVAASFIGLFTIAILHHKKVTGSVLLGIIAASVIYWVGVFAMGGNPFASLSTANFVPPFTDMFNLTFLKFNFSTLFSLGIFSAVMTIVTFCIVDMFDTIGTLYGTAKRAGMIDPETDEMPDMNKAMLSDSVATIVGASTGTSTVTTFIESAAGVEEGGRTGLTSVVTGILFLACMFIAPIAALVPACATTAALVFVGTLMVGSLKEVDYEDVAQSVPVVLLLIFMVGTGSIGGGIGIGLIAYSLIKLLTGKAKEVSVLTIILALLFVGKFFIIF